VVPESGNRQSIIDEEHLKLLSLGYMISAATSAFFSLFGLMYVAMGFAMSAVIAHAPGVAAKPNQMPPAFIGHVFAGIGFAFFTAMIVLAAAKLKAAFCIRGRRSRTFCMVMAGISCLEVPYGTVLGALSFIVLGRESVAQLFHSGVVTKPTDSPAATSL
jgi:hypothetical protein